MKEEFQAKLEKIRKMMAEEDLDAVLIARNDNFSWITGGGRGWVSRSSETAVGWILITKDRAYLIASNIEMERLLREELSMNLERITYMWYESPMEILEKKFKGLRIGSDTSLGEYQNISKDLRNLRMILTDWEKKRVRDMGKELEYIFERVLESSHQGMTERELAGIIEGELVKNGFEVPVILVFSEKTRKLYRHNLPGDSELGRFFFVSICASKRGLVLSMTRSIAFGEIDSEIEKQHELNASIDAHIRSETRPGRTLSDMFWKIKEIYKNHGKAKEFDLHHQGGIAGYNTREEKATPKSSTVLKENMLIAWNPTITGTKSEDTFLLGEDGYLTFTRNSRWPVLEFDIDGTVVRRPGVKIL